MKEDVLILKIMETQEQYDPASIFHTIKTTADPLNVTNTSSVLEQVAPEVIFVLYIFRVIEVTVEQCVIAVRTDVNCDYLVELLSMFLMHCLHIFESGACILIFAIIVCLFIIYKIVGSHCKMANTAINLINGNSVLENSEEVPIDAINSSFLKLSYFFPTVVFQWCYFLTLLSYNNRKFWSSIMQMPETYGVLNQV